MNPDGTFSYHPAPNYHGEDSFIYRVRDGQYESAPAKVTILIDPVDDAPAATADKYYYVGGPINTPASKGVLSNDVDVEGSPLTAVLTKSPQYGQLQLEGDGSFSYTPGPTFAGTDQFTYRANDGGLSSTETIVTIASPVRVVVDNQNLALPLNAEAQGFFDVYLQVAAGFDFSAGSYSVTLRTPPESGLALVGTSRTSAPQGPLFTTEPNHQPIENGLLVTGAAAGGTALVVDGRGLFRVHFTVSPDFEGDVPLIFEVATTSLLDGSGSPLPIERAAGAVNVKRLPGAISSISASAMAPNRVRLSWEDISENEIGFEIERSDGGPFVQIATVGRDISVFEDNKLQSSIEYAYRVRAYNAAGDGPTSNNFWVTTPQLAALSGTSGNDTYHILRSGTILQVYENTSPQGTPTYSSALADLPETLSIETLGGHDALFVNTGRESTLGLERLVYAPGDGSNKLTIQNGTARVDTVANGIAELETLVDVGAHLVTPRVSQGYLNIKSHARVTLLDDGGTSVVRHLSLGEGATLDIKNNAFIIDHFGTWSQDWVRETLRTGTGIESSTVEQANATSPGTWAVGYADNGQLPLGPYTTFRGVPVDHTAILMAFTRNGDANLDGIVDDDDVTAVGAAYAPGESGKSWALGDFDYNSFVDDEDVTVLGAFYDPSAEPVAAPLLGPVVAWPSVVAGSADHATDSTTIVVAQSPDRTTVTTTGLPALRPAVETFGQTNVRGQETRAQQNLTDVRGQETRAQQVLRDERLGADREAIDLVAESIAGESYDSDRLATSPRRAGMRLAAIDGIWASWK
jgi:hypothetical protein